MTNTTKRGEVERFDPVGYDGLSALMELCADGDYIEHSAYARIVATLAAENQALVAVCKATISAYNRTPNGAAFAKAFTNGPLDMMRAAIAKEAGNG